jgi:hypothetical protein
MLGGGLLDLDAFELAHGESLAANSTFFNIQDANERQGSEGALRALY